MPSIIEKIGNPPAKPETDREREERLEVQRIKEKEMKRLKAKEQRLQEIQQEAEQYLSECRQLLETSQAKSLLEEVNQVLLSGTGQILEEGSAKSKHHERHFSYFDADRYDEWDTPYATSSISLSWTIPEKPGIFNPKKGNTVLKIIFGTSEKESGATFENVVIKFIPSKKDQPSLCLFGENVIASGNLPEDTSNAIARGLNQVKTEFSEFSPSNLLKL